MAKKRVRVSRIRNNYPSFYILCVFTWKCSIQIFKCIQSNSNRFWNVTLYKDVSQNALSNINIDYYKWDMEMLFTKQRRNKNKFLLIFSATREMDTANKKLPVCLKSLSGLNNDFHYISNVLTDYGKAWVNNEQEAYFMKFSYDGYHWWFQLKLLLFWK